MTTNLLTDLAAIAATVSLIALPAVTGSYNQSDMLAGLSTTWKLPATGSLDRLKAIRWPVTTGQLIRASLPTVWRP